MKKIFLAILLYTCVANVSAQTKSSIDSIYFLIDTTKISVNDRMWDIHLEYPSLKVYSILCPCLQYAQQPTFVYSITANKGEIITKKQLHSIKLTSISLLILKSKQLTAANYVGNNKIFCIEPEGKKYIVHQVSLIRPLRPSTLLPDYTSIFPDSAIKSKKP